MFECKCCDKEIIDDHEYEIIKLEVVEFVKCNANGFERSVTEAGVFCSYFCMNKYLSERRNE